jgi:hypothetical protein
MFDVTTQGDPAGLRGKVGRLVHHLIPDLDQRAYARARAKDRRARTASGEFGPVARGTRQLSGVGDRPPHVVVVPSDGPSQDAWMPGVRNLYFEAYATFAENAGGASVSAFFAEPDESPEQWQTRLVDYLRDSRATHLLTHVECDPGNLESWTWDTFWQEVSPHWDGVFLGGMFDSSYRFTEAKAQIMARMSPNFVLVDICIPMDGALVRGRREVGPVNMPMSQASLSLLDERLSGVSPIYDLSFFGVLYDYRVELLDRLRAEGVNVAVNPHRSDAATDGTATRANQPSWLDYMAGIAASRTTVNFSQSNAGPFEQLKTRVMEVGLAGAYLLTDDHDRTNRYWSSRDFAEFTSPTDLVAVAQSVLSDEPARFAAATRFGERARVLARDQYWGSIETVLQARGLPSLGIKPFTG